jgi:hypothetical protein
MKFGIHIGHMGGPLGETRKLWKFADGHGSSAAMRELPGLNRPGSAAGH